MAVKDLSVERFFDGMTDLYNWESTKLTYVREEEPVGMYVEEREGRKRKWQPLEAKVKKVDANDDKERKAPPKKVFASVGDMGGSGGSSSSSHLSPGWQVNDLDLDLPGELSMNDALLSLPSLAVFKQEAPSPTGGATALSPSRRGWPQRRADERSNNTMIVDNTQRNEIEDNMCQQQTAQNILNQHNVNQETLQCQQSMQANALAPANGYHSPTNNNEIKGNGLLMCSPNNSLESFLSPAQHQRSAENSFKEDTRFQYVLAAATSIATKQHEETLTYLNQGQPYEIKLKKLGDLSHYKGKILKSVIKICFHERRLQYMEKEQISQWHSERPGERIVEVDIPLSYGIIRVQQPTITQLLNCVEVLWDPTKDVGVYIKVNCISTEFTAKKHGGEKGVPFRVQIETFLANTEEPRLHAAACQIKVFKLKGADRKHKQDREKVMRRPPSDLEKYQSGCDATILTTLSNDAMMPLPNLVPSSPRYSPELCATQKNGPGTMVVSKPQGLISPTNQMKPLYSQDCNDMKAGSPPCHSPGAILPDLPQATDDPDKYYGLNKEASSIETQVWLTNNRFAQHTATFANFSGADLLRLSRDDIIQICGLPDGIRLFNALHAKRIEPRLTVYVCPAGSNIYSALYLHMCCAQELLQKLNVLLQAELPSKICETVLVLGPHGAHIRLTDELVRHLPDNSTYRVEIVNDSSLLLSPTN